VADCPRCGARYLSEQGHQCASGAIPEPVPGVYGNTATVRLPAPLTADEEAIVRAMWLEGWSEWHWGHTEILPLGDCSECDWLRVWSTLDAVRDRLADATAFCIGDWPCEASTTAASLERERNDLQADLATERAMGASMSADLTVLHQDLQRAEQERDAARAILARVVEYWSDDDDIGDDSFLTLLRDARALLAVRK